MRFAKIIGPYLQGVRDRRKLTVFAVCVSISALVWLLLSLSKSYNMQLIVPVRYVNFPENKTLINAVPRTIAVNLRGSGYDLIRYDDRLTKDTLTINLDNLSMVVVGEYQRGYLDPSVISKSLRERLNGKLAISSVLTDSIEFLFDLRVNRSIAVKPVVELSLAKGYVLIDSVHCTPSEVTLTGALSVLDTLRWVPTQKVVLHELEKSVRIPAPLNLSALGRQTRANTDTVFVVIQVDQLTERSFLLVPEKLNVPDSIALLTFPNAVEVTFQLPMSRYDQVTEADFSIFVDYNDLDEDIRVLPVHLERWPVIATNINMRPTQVEIVLNRK
ncbi:MAG: hypothetical protein Kow0075_06030 [Salibacteraceae bacterium]